MALDEPKSDDSVFDEGGCRFLMAPDVTEVVRQMGGVRIDYIDEPTRKGYTIQVVDRNCGSGGCDCGS
jgi:Fe-S cluster assembly iron-binding protein IscA